MRTQSPIELAPPTPLQADVTRVMRAPQQSPCVSRSRVYRFALDAGGRPVELGSGRFAKAYLGEEQWLESKTVFRRDVAIKLLQRGVSEEDGLRFQMEKELIERVQGHPNIIGLYASGEADNPEFIPESIRDRVVNDFIILERCDLSLEERLKGSRNRGQRDDLLAYPMRERLFRVLEYMLPLTAGVEYAHVVRGACHRDIKPANVLLRLPDPRLRGATLDVRLADFNVGKLRQDPESVNLTRLQTVPGTLFFQAPEQETNVIEVLANVEEGSNEVQYFEDFYMYITQNDTFQIFNRPERYMVTGVDRERKKILLSSPFAEPTERNVRAKVVKSVDRPADIYSLGALFYYLITGAYGNPKSLFDAFHKFIEYERHDVENTIDSYLAHEYRVIQSLRAPKKEGEREEMAPADRFFSYKHYLDGNGELLDLSVMRIVAKAMIRNKPDSYCQAWEIDTNGISELIGDLLALCAEFGVDERARASLQRRYTGPRPRRSFWSRLFRR
ncbi:MAG TPA: protein kinase [Polyangia bacterium]|jgi:serine/threonine protein kinase